MIYVPQGRSAGSFPEQLVFLGLYKKKKSPGNEIAARNRAKVSPAVFVFAQFFLVYLNTFSVLFLLLVNMLVHLCKARLNIFMVLALYIVYIFVIVEPVF